MKLLLFAAAVAALDFEAILSQTKSGEILSVEKKQELESLKSQIDEILKLDAQLRKTSQKISPAFQWTQNATNIFIAVKFTRRWNAPGALQVTNPSVTFTTESFIFTGEGEHSNNLYAYHLSLSTFGPIDPEKSKWNMASVGRLNVQLQKAVPGKWSRLLVGTSRPDNMGMWMDMADKMEEGMKGLEEAEESALTCKLKDAYYCPSSDSCVTSSCAECAGKRSVDAKFSQCAGPPVGKVKSATTKDSNADRGIVNGFLEMKMDNSLKLDSTEIHILFADAAKIPIAKSAHLKSTVFDNYHMDNVVIPDKAEFYLLYAVNEHGRSSEYLAVKIVDKIIPSNNPTEAKLDAKVSEDYLSGRLTVTVPPGSNALKVVVYFGSDEKTKLATKALAGMQSVPVNGGEIVINLTGKIPASATHLLTYCRGSDGDLDEAPLATILPTSRDEM